MTKTMTKAQASAVLAALSSGGAKDAAAKATLKQNVAFPPEWVYRRVFVGRNLLSALEVPRYIVRIDIDEPGCVGTHGWQVRYHQPGSRLISDSTFDTARRMGTPLDSLTAAKLYLLAIWTGPRARELRPEKAGKRIPTGMPGVRVRWDTRRGLEMCNVRVDNLEGKPIASLYVGTRRTATERKLAAKVREGRRIRREYLESLGGRVVMPARSTASAIG